MHDMNESGAIAIWPDFDHVVPDWDAILDLGFSGLKKRAEEYKDLHRKNDMAKPSIDQSSFTLISNKCKNSVKSPQNSRHI